MTDYNTIIFTPEGAIAVNMPDSPQPTTSQIFGGNVNVAIEDYTKRHSEYQKAVKEAIDKGVLFEDWERVEVVTMISWRNRKTDMPIDFIPQFVAYPIPSGYKVVVEETETVEDGGGCYVAGMKLTAKLIKI